jgi:hypothetical protein
MRYAVSGYLIAWPVAGAALSAAVTWKWRAVPVGAPHCTVAVPVAALLVMAIAQCQGAASPDTLAQVRESTE